MSTDALLARRTVDLAADRLRKGIVQGEFPAGSLLPPERDLAERFGISRPTLRAALARLEAEGLVRSRQGEGVRVLPFQASAGMELLPWLLTYQGANASLVAQFLELRRALAGEAVSLACDRATASHIAELQHLSELQDTEENLDAFAARDLAFARALLAAAGNLPMQLLLNTVERVYRSHQRLVRALLADKVAVRQSYRAVIGLIRSRQSTLAREAVRLALGEIDSRAVRFLSSKEG
jgi:DNA-binding FadR family transcriptional regulator